ncbi:hypothetical protein [Longimicrobium terrae]|uniref:Uncharacterized protein n=1 Tax=Longimicrobium terrae TaxID=1639882 RepID=A0A841GWA1_9BACT|nr:hypothetical protein [Longimicrobium terrae]MBB4635882.1 hypothetical protein [Longimicrobium terrae]MBB6070278.1 hypothetical protein [Longimicrobium terrae]NNC30782.1 hypothetical protein [Longimicrobium terrae]
MKPTPPRPSASLGALGALDVPLSLLGIAGMWTLAGVMAAGFGLPDPVLNIAGLGTAGLAWCRHHARCRRRPPPVRSLAGFLWAPLGRVRRVEAGTPILGGKRYCFQPTTVSEPLIVWAGWWNGGRFAGAAQTDDYFFVQRRSRLAIPAAWIVTPAR